MEGSNHRTSGENGLNPKFFNDACAQFIQSMSEIGNMFDIFQGGDMALNLSKKMKNFPNLPISNSTPSLQQTSNSHCSNDTDASPIDLSKSTHKRSSETPRNEGRRDKSHRKREKVLVMSKEEQEMEVRRLQAELKEEENKLMLLRLIKRSQQVFTNTAKITPNLPSTSKNTHPKSSNDISNITSNGSDHSNIKTFENNHVIENNDNNINKSPSTKNANNHANNINSSNSHHSKLNSSHGKDLSNKYDKVNNNIHNNQSNSSKTSSPSLANFYNGFSNFLNSNFNHPSTNGSVDAFMGGLYPGLNRSGTPQSSRATPNQSDAQRQQAARLALRKQLEKSLMQIPLPKPLIPELNFVPNANSVEFVALLGLEEVVKNLVDGEARRRGEAAATDIKYIFNPFKCVQCGSDFTPVWKRDKPGSKNVICERCVTSNQRRALKNEHTNRLKAVFSKAAVKEQEFNKNILRPPSPSVANKSSSLISSPSIPPPPLPLSSLSSLSSLSNFFNPSSVSKNIFSPESLYQLSASDFSNMASLFSMPPSFWPPQNFPFPNPSTAQALSQQLMFPFSGSSFPSKSDSMPTSSSSSSSLLAAQRQFLMDFMPARRSQQDGSPVLWRS